MSDFRIWGTIYHIGPALFFVVATVIADPIDPERRPRIRTYTATGLQEAESVRDAMMVEVGAQVVARGDRVVDVET